MSDELVKTNENYIDGYKKGYEEGYLKACENIKKCFMFSGDLEKIHKLINDLKNI